MLGACLRALVKIMLIAFSVLPTHLSSTVDRFTLMKLTPHSPAAARASSVLPQPGGPNSRIPPPAFLP